VSATSVWSGHEYVVMLTQRCNFRCSYCYQTRAAIDQSTEVLTRLATAVRRDGRPGTRVVFHGGEPLLRMDLIRHTLALLSDDGDRPLCGFGIVTNGALIDAQAIELFRRGRFRVDLSFDGCREAQRYRDERSFERIVGSIRELVPLHEAGELELGVCVTVTLDNLPFLARSVAFLADLGVPRVEIEGDLFGGWTEGTEREVDRQVEEVVRLMERRASEGLPIPVSRLQPRPHDERGRWWETEDERCSRRENRLDLPECGCGSAGASVVHPDGSVWTSPLLVPALAPVAPARLSAPHGFSLGSWRQGDGRVPRADAGEQGPVHEPILGPKRRRRSIFGECGRCPFVAECCVCPAASHLPGATKPPEEVPPLLCRLNQAFLSRCDRIRRPPRLADALLSIARARCDARDPEGRGAPGRERPAECAPGPTSRLPRRGGNARGPREDRAARAGKSIVSAGGAWGGRAGRASPRRPPGS